LLIAGLRSIAIDLQSSKVLDLPAQIVNMLPWFLMILTLMVATSGVLERVVRFTPERLQPAVRRFLRAGPRLRSASPSKSTDPRRPGKKPGRSFSNLLRASDIVSRDSRPGRSRIGQGQNFAYLVRAAAGLCTG